MLSTFPSPATQGWVTAHNKLFGNFVNSHLLGKYHLFLIICSIHIIDFILPALSHTLCSMVVNFSICVFGCVLCPFSQFSFGSVPPSLTRYLSGEGVSQSLLSPRFSLTFSAGLSGEQH